MLEPTRLNAGGWPLRTSSELLAVAAPALRLTITTYEQLEKTSGMRCGREKLPRRELALDLVRNTSSSWKDASRTDACMLSCEPGALAPGVSELAGASESMVGEDRDGRLLSSCVLSALASTSAISTSALPSPGLPSAAAASTLTLAMLPLASRLTANLQSLQELIFRGPHMHTTPTQ